MTSILVTPTTLRVHFAPWEKALGLVRDQEFPRDRVIRVRLAPHGTAAVRGLRAPGLGLPGMILLGTWRRRGEKSLVSVRRGEPAVVVDLRGSSYDRLILGHPDAAHYVTELSR